MHQTEAFNFVFIDSLIGSASQDAVDHTISRKRPPVAVGLPYLLIELLYISMPVVWTAGQVDGRTIIEYQLLPNFLGCTDNHIFLSIVLRYNILLHNK